jgi:hypothetical protein
VDPGLARALIGLACLAVLAGAGDLARARQPDQAGPGPPPPVPPAVLERQAPTPPPAPEPSNPIVPAPVPGPPTEMTPVTALPTPSLEAPPLPKPPAPKPETKAAPPAAPPAPPPGPPPPLRSPTAILQVLDKVTAETLKFEAPVGRHVRYKTLIFTVRVCETRGAGDPQPRPSAYVVIDSEAPTLPGHAPLPGKEVYNGWMFAEGPGLHPFEHPIYDAWLVACSAAAPVS